MMQQRNVPMSALQTLRNRLQQARKSQQWLQQMMRL